MGPPLQKQRNKWEKERHVREAVPHKKYKQREQRKMGGVPLREKRKGPGRIVRDLWHKRACKPGSVF